MKRTKAFLKRLFNRKVRAALYGAGLAAVPALVASGDIPAWAIPIAGPFLLALLNLKPNDLEPPADELGEYPEQD